MSCENLREQLGHLHETLPVGEAKVEAGMIHHLLEGACPTQSTISRLPGVGPSPRIVENIIRSAREFLENQGIDSGQGQ